MDGGFALRDYQQEAVDGARDCLREHRSTLIVMPTGTGKTRVFSEMIARATARGIRALVLVHRDELVRQTVKALRRVGCESEVEKADERASRYGSFAAVPVVATVQTLKGSRLEQWLHGSFGLVIVDEAHHAPAKTYRDILDYFSEAKVVGVTATPDRSDKTALGNVFESVAFVYEIREAISDGWLVPIVQKTIECDDLDLSQIKSRKGDLAEGELQIAMTLDRVLHQVASPLVREAGDRSTIVFTAGVDHAHALAAVIAGYVGAEKVDAVDGKTPMDERRMILKRFQDGDTQFLVNCAVLCLDEKTEILTRRGFLGIDELDEGDQVANWTEDGRIWWEKPKRVLRRERGLHEPMVTVRGPRTSIRVTYGHRMVVARRGRNWEVRQSQDIVGEKLQIPVSGYARPAMVDVEQPEDVTPRQRAARIRGSSYQYRKKYGLGTDEAKTLATAMVDRRIGLRHRRPRELSDAECWLIGFWIGDGSANRPRSGGVEYVLCQSYVYPIIVGRIEACLEQLGLHSVRHEMCAKDGVSAHVRWSLARGTGGHGQEREGVFHLEPYLQKDTFDWVWGLDERRFDSLLDGLWNADGNHGQGLPRSSYRISNTRAHLLDTLQAVATCRGYSTTLKWAPGRKAAHAPLGEFRYRKKERHEMVRQRFEMETEYRTERVWCVTTNTSFIITRRDGHVAVMGNCEGFDAPHASCIAMARPTKSRLLYTQGIGRGLRIHPGKEDCLVLDFVGNAGRHTLIAPIDVLGGEDLDDDVREEALKKARDGIRLDVAIEEAKAERVERLKRDRRSRHVQAMVDYNAPMVDPFTAVTGVDVGSGRSPGGVTAKQIGYLGKAGINAKRYTRKQASRVISHLMDRRDKNLCTFRQARTLSKHGLRNNLSFDDAKRAMDALAGARWKPTDAILKEFGP